MTDNEIIKALERCRYHRECCFCNSVEECGNKENLTISALDLINRQKAEIDQYAQDQHELMIEMDKLLDIVEKQKAEIEKLETLEYYKKILDYYALQFGTVRDKQKVITEAKAEAVKEFADTLHDEVFIMSRTPAGDIDFNDFEVVLRKVQKETAKE